MTIQYSTPVHSRYLGKALFCSAALLAALSCGQVLAQDQTQTSTSTTTTTTSADTEAHKAERVVSDSWITTKVKSELLANSMTKGLHVRVKTRHGVVILSGKLATQDAIDQVKSVAAKIKGVKSVDTGGLIVAAQ